MRASQSVERRNWCPDVFAEFTGILDASGDLGVGALKFGTWFSGASIGHTLRLMFPDSKRIP